MAEYSILKKLCLCGCGGEIIKKANKFLLGHNGKLNRNWIKIGHNSNIGKECSEDKKKQISKSLLGHEVKEEVKEKLRVSMKEQYSSGNRIHWNLGNKGKTIHRKDCSCYICKGTKSGILNPFYNKKHTKETKKLFSIIHGGTGIPYENNEYSDKFNIELKETIRKRDNYTCKNCGMLEEEHLMLYGVNLSCHHIDYNKKNSTESNLISLCIQCHSRTNINRDYWKELMTIKEGIR